MQHLCSRFILVGSLTFCLVPASRGAEVSKAPATNKAPAVSEKLPLDVENFLKEDTPTGVTGPSKKAAQNLKEASEPLTTLQGFSVNQICADLGTEKCIAIQKTKTEPKNVTVRPDPLNQKMGLAGKSASNWCRSVGGRPQIFKPNGIDEDEYCGFKDKSFINSWELYKACHSIQKTN